MEMPDGLTAVPITIGPPQFSTKDANPHIEKPRVDLFLYRVTENGYLQNQEIPGRDSRLAYGHPPLSLNLHYLVTAYGNAEVAGETVTYDDTMAQFLLGSTMRVFHDVPIVTDGLVTNRPPSGRTLLHESLLHEYEHVKMTLEPLSLEDLTKVWTALTLRYRLSAAYVVNVVQIESRRAKRFPQAVGKPVSAITPPLPGDPPSAGPWVYVLPIQTPTITAVTVRRLGETAEQPFAYARVHDTLVLRGTSLSGPVTTVGFGDLRVPAAFAKGDHVEAEIPDVTIPGAGAIPPQLQLQPGVRTARIVVSDPLVPQSAFTSNEAAFMLVPAVDPLGLTYGPGPPRTLTIVGTRLIGPAPGGETVIGRTSIDRSGYISATPAQIVVPIPDALPTRGVHAIVSGPLGDPVAIGNLVTPQLAITIAGSTKNLARTLPVSIPRAQLPGILAALIHDASPADPHFTGARVDLWNDRLVVVPGGLTDSITIVSGGGSTLAADLALTAAQPPGASSALISGVLGSPPPLSSPSPRVTVKIGAQPTVTISVPRATSLAALAAALQTTINAASAAPEYAGALVAISGSQLLVIPGTAAPVTFSGAPSEDPTVAELQLQAKFAVRVRVNGAESTDPAFLVLPQ
jgi:hypothetical protein